MPTKLARNYFNLCFTKIKNPLSSQPSPITNTADHHRRTPSDATTSTTSAVTFITNYNSLYEATNASSKPLFSPKTDGTDPDTYVAVDFITAFTSHRFFFSSPGRSNSIIESSTTATTIAESTTPSLSFSSLDDIDAELLYNNSLAIPTYSPDPYIDFRRSMQEMVAAREEMEVTKSSWEFLHELLLYYLALNPKSTHKYILKAFADLARVIKPPLPPFPPSQAAEEVGIRGEISGQENDRDLMNYFNVECRRKID